MFSRHLTESVSPLQAYLPMDNYLSKDLFWKSIVRHVNSSIRPGLFKWRPEGHMRTRSNLWVAQPVEKQRAKIPAIVQTVNATSPAQIPDVMTDFIARLNENFSGSIEWTCSAHRGDGFLPDTRSLLQQKGTYPPEHRKCSLPSTSGNSYSNLLTCTCNYPLPWHGSLALTGLRGSGVMSTYTSSLTLRK